MHRSKSNRICTVAAGVLSDLDSATAAKAHVAEPMLKTFAVAALAAGKALNSLLVVLFAVFQDGMVVRSLLRKTWPAESRAASMG